MDREEYEALLDTFRNLQIASQRAVSRLETLQPQTVRVVEQVPARVTSSDTTAESAPYRVTAPATRRSRSSVSTTSSRRTGYRDALEGNGAQEQFGLKKRDIVQITNDVVIGTYVLKDSQKIGPVQYFTDRFVVVSLKYKFDPDNEREEFKYKLVKRESQNIRLVQRTNNYN